MPLKPVPTVDQTLQTKAAEATTSRRYFAIYQTECLSDAALIAFADKSPLRDNHRRPERIAACREALAPYNCLQESMDGEEHYMIVDQNRPERAAIETIIAELAKLQYVEKYARLVSGDSFESVATSVARGELNGISGGTIILNDEGRRRAELIQADEELHARMARAAGGIEELNRMRRPLGRLQRH